jgi:SAM-dependent methyltransferase
MSIAQRLAAVQKSFRMKRMRRFVSVFPVTRDWRVLDVGGTPDIWALLGTSGLGTSGAPSLVILNMPRAGQVGEPGQPRLKHAVLNHVHGDGCHLPFADKSFDIVFSNSVIEHVGGPEAQTRFAREIVRTGRGYWVQTPNRYFPVETHLLTPFVHLLPRSWRAFIVRRFTVWQWINRPDAESKRFYIEHFVSDIRLLSADEMQRLFPDAVILRERFLGFTKSLVAYRLPEGDNSGGFRR